MGEQQHIADRGRIREQHHQPIDTQALADRGRHAVLQSAHVVRIEMHGFFIAGVFLRDLRAKPLRLIFGVVELTEAVGQFPAGDEKLKALGDRGILVAAPRQG